MSMTQKSIFLTLILYSWMGHLQAKTVKVAVDPTCQRSIGGISTLKRGNYFGMFEHGYEHINRGLAPQVYKELIERDNAWFIGATNHLTEYVNMHTPLKEDDQRPGYVEEDSVKGAVERFRTWEDETAYPTMAKIKKRFPDLDLIAIGHGGFPGFMLNEPADPNKKNAYRVQDEAARLKDYDAAGHVTALVAKYYFDKWNRPTYWEPMNEPPLWSQNEAIARLHLGVARQFKEIHPDIKVGGPCFCTVNWQRQNFKEWHTTMKPFIDLAGPEMDFISFHAYDYFIDGKRNICTGSRVEAALDFLQNYTLQEFGTVKPILVSEHGATGNNMFLGKDGFTCMPMPQDNIAWAVMRAVNGHIFTFLDCPDRVMKSVPFIIPEMWGQSYWQIKYPWIAFRHLDREPREPLIATHLVKFYRLWKNVQGERVRIQSSDPDVQVHAFKQKNTLFVCLNNLHSETKQVAIDLGRDTKRNIQRVTVSRLYKNGQLVLNKPEALEGIGLSYRIKDVEGQAPVLEEDVRVSQWTGQVYLRADECAIYQLKLRNNKPFTKKIDETIVYGDRTLVPIQAQTPESFTLKLSPADLERAESASLRVGIARALGKDQVPSIRFNGKDVQVTLEKSIDKQITESRGMDVWGIRLIALEPSQLKAENTVDVSFDDASGHISAIALKITQTL